MDINLGLTATASGTVDVITATYSPAPTLVDKKILFLVASGANTSTTPTFSPNGLTAHTITKNGGEPLIAGDIAAAGAVYILEYNLANTRWELLNPAPDHTATYVTARNNTGSTITKGQVVYISGAIGQNPTIALARSNAESTSFNIGVAAFDIANNTNAHDNVITVGLLSGIDTSAFIDGDKLYLSSSVAGGLQSTPPTSPNFGAFIGFILNSHVTQGKILITASKTIISQNTTIDTSLISVPSNNAVKIFVNQYSRGDFSAVLGIVQLSPADGITYFFGGAPKNVLSSVSGTNRIYIFKPGTINKVYVVVQVGNGSSETSTIYLRKNDSTDSVITSSFTTNATAVFTNTSLGLSVVAGDFVEFKWTTPVWVTNPTNIFISAQFLVE